MIDPSLAAGLRRGGTRRMLAEIEVSIDRMGTPPPTRAAWLRWLRRGAHAAPGIAVLDETTVGRGKHQRLLLLIAALVDSGEWCAQALVAGGKERDFKTFDFYTAVSRHAVDRSIQWTGETDVTAALRTVSPALMWTTVARHPSDPFNQDRDDDWLAGYPGGALVMAANRDGGRIAVTALRDRDRWRGRTVREAAQRLPEGFSFWRWASAQAEWATMTGGAH
jgi:hypothetical protein